MTEVFVAYSLWRNFPEPTLVRSLARRRGPLTQPRASHRHTAPRPSVNRDVVASLISNLVTRCPSSQGYPFVLHPSYFANTLV